MNDGKDELLSYIENIKKDFSNFNVDMIYNLPHQTNEIWHDDLETAIALGSNHLTIYPLVLLEKTIFYSDYVKNGIYASPDQGREIELFNWSLNRLSMSNFTDHYSVRDLAKPGYAAHYIRMNAECNNIVALGAGAHGYLAHTTYRNLRTTNQYISYLLEKDLLPLEAQRFCTLEEEMQRYMVMGLRLNNFDTSSFAQKFDRTVAEVFGEKIEILVKSGYLRQNGSKLTHTREGLIWGNNIRTYFEDDKGSSVGYTDTVSIGETGKDHYSKITRIKASGDVEANIDQIQTIPDAKAAV
jgi:oxygen-independent coproporphyrinogen-3 oxidase